MSINPDGRIPDDLLCLDEALAILATHNRLGVTIHHPEALHVFDRAERTVKHFSNQAMQREVETSPDVLRRVCAWRICRALNVPTDKEHIEAILPLLARDACRWSDRDRFCDCGRRSPCASTTAAPTSESARPRS